MTHTRALLAIMLTGACHRGAIGASRPLNDALARSPARSPCVSTPWGVACVTAFDLATSSTVASAPGSRTRISCERVATLRVRVTAPDGVVAHEQSIPIAVTDSVGQTFDVCVPAGRAAPAGA